MSCNLVSDTLISALVTAAARSDRYAQLPAPDWSKLSTEQREAFHRVAGRLGGSLPRGENVAKTYPSEVGRALALMNVQSVDANYQGRHTTADDFAEALSYTFEVTTLDVVSLIKQVHNYAYQSCEAPGWDSSWAKAFCEQLEGVLIRNLPGYDAAPWGV
jgi:hypothetical protein